MEEKSQVTPINVCILIFAVWRIKGFKVSFVKTPKEEDTFIRLIESHLIILNIR